MPRKSTSKTDRRAKYTRLVINEAYITLLKKKNFEQITVTEICELADINRCTFYLHYSDSRAVMEALEERALKKYIQYIGLSLMDEERRQALSDKFYRFVRDSEDGDLFYKLVHGVYGSGNIYSRAIDAINGIVLEEIVNHYHISKREAELYNIFIISACSAVGRKWYLDGYKDLERENAFVNRMMSAINNELGIDARDLSKIFASKFEQYFLEQEDFDHEHFWDSF